MAWCRSSFPLSVHPSPIFTTLIRDLQARTPGADRPPDLRFARKPRDRGTTAVGLPTLSRRTVQAETTQSPSFQADGVYLGVFEALSLWHASCIYER